MARYYTGKSCSSGHFSERWVSGKCIDCYNEYKENNRQQLLIQRSEYRKNNKNLIRSRDKQYWVDNKDIISNKRKSDPEINEYQRHYKRTNRVEIAAKMKAYRIKNHDIIAENRSRYRASKLNATPPWFSKEHRIAVRKLHHKARELTIQTSIVHSVDHIIPLQGDTVCGLHVPWNLRVVTLSENCSKSNKLLT